MTRRFRLIWPAALLALAPLTGCAGLTGTWKATPEDTPGPFKFGAVSFVGDHTYTAEMHYQERVLTNVGGWSTSGDQLTLSAPARTYRYEVKGDKLYITDPDMGITVEMDRFKP